MFGLNDWFADGATAEFCIAKPANLSPKPPSLSDPEAASVPISVSTAWQGLHLRAKVRNGERVLIHGGAGAVGLFAVQLARSRGAYVIASCSKANMDFVKQLGADEVIDYRASRFEDEDMVDVVFDTVGADTRQILQCSQAWRKVGDDRRRRRIQRRSTREERFLHRRAERGTTRGTRKPFDSGELRAFVKAELPMEDAGRACRSAIGGRPGKMALLVRTAQGGA